MSLLNSEINQFPENKAEGELNQELNPKDKQSKILGLEAKLKTTRIICLILVCLVVFLSICLTYKITREEKKVEKLQNKENKSEISFAKENLKSGEAENKDLRNADENVKYNIAIYTVKSSFLPQNSMEDPIKLLVNLEKTSRIKFTSVDSPEMFSKYDLGLFYIQYFGSDITFSNEVFPTYKGPYYLLSYGQILSLPASLEILSFIRLKNKKGEIVYGSDDYIIKRIQELVSISKKVTSEKAWLGVLGKPGEWLIGSNVDYKKAKEILNIELIDIPQEEINEEISKHSEKMDPSLINTNFNPTEMDKAFQVYKAFEKLIEKYNLSGLTVRCVDIMQKFNTTPCIALALLNKNNIIGTCEGDLATMITAYEILKAVNEHAFQANALVVDTSKNYVEFSHCTLPLDMVSCPDYDLYHDRGMGVAIHGKMTPGEVTVVKISSQLNEFFVENGELLENQCKTDRCSNQIAVRLEGDLNYFLKSALGNHHLIIYGHHKKEIKDYFEALGLRQVV